MLTIGLQDSWWRVYPEPEGDVEVGVNKGGRAIDRFLYCPHVLQNMFGPPSPPQ